MKKNMIDAMCEELLIQKIYLGDKKINTIYFGGGTPSLLLEQELQQILNTIHNNFIVSEEVEITLEANPDDLSPDKLSMLFTNRINRLSIGIQSFNDEFLKFFNRAHDSLMAQDSVKNARSAGFENISVDLIFGIPNQSINQFRNDIEKIIALKTEHISIYGLTIEEKTVFGKWHEKNKLQPIDEEVATLQLEMIMDELSKVEYEQYEISNFSKQGFKSQHNSSYWNQEHYLGIGPSAHSYNGTSRQFNIPNNTMYVSSIKEGRVPFDIEILDRTQKINEYILTKLRTSGGISLSQMNSQFDFDFSKKFDKEIKQFCQRNLIILDDNISLTIKGKLVADSITESFMLD